MNEFRKRVQQGNFMEMIKKFLPKKDHAAFEKMFESQVKEWEDIYQEASTNIDTIINKEINDANQSENKSGPEKTNDNSE